jgi:hypothetical protein
MARRMDWDSPRLVDKKERKNIHGFGSGFGFWLVSKVEMDGAFGCCFVQFTAPRHQGYR